MQCFKTLILPVLAAIIGFTYGKAWWSFVKDYPVDGAVLIGLIGLVLLGGLALGEQKTALDRGRHLVGRSVMFAGYLLASLF